MEETVSVPAESPLLELASASAGQVIDEKRISLLPLSDGNPFQLARMVPGVAFTGDLKFSRPFDNGGTSGIGADGAVGGNALNPHRYEQVMAKAPKCVKKKLPWQGKIQVVKNGVVTKEFFK